MIEVVVVFIVFIALLVGAYYYLTKGKVYVVTDIDGTKYNVEVNSDADPELIESYENGRFWKEGEQHFFKEHASTDMISIDLGAGIGDQTLYLAKVSKEVLALEPSRVLSSILKRNIYTNNRVINRVRVFDDLSRLESFWEERGSPDIGVLVLPESEKRSIPSKMMKRAAFIAYG